MINISKTSIEFIEKRVLKEIGFNEISDENISEIIDFIIDNYEVPLAQAKEAGDNIDEKLLKEATKVVTEITSNPNW